MKLKKAAIWGIAVVLLAGGIAAGAVVLNSRPETKDNLINMAKIIKPRGDKTHVIVKVSQNIGTEDYTEPYEDDKDYSNDNAVIAVIVASIIYLALRPAMKKLNMLRDL